jgi:hypothetical protein
MNIFGKINDENFIIILFHYFTDLRYLIGKNIFKKFQANGII